MVMKPGNVKV